MTKSPPDQLRSLLEAELKNNSIVLSRGGKIDRTYYATQLGYDRGYFGQKCKSVLAEFEGKLGNPTSAFDAKLPEMRQWLEERYQADELGVRNGKIDRSAFSAQFGSRNWHALINHKKVRDLIEEYDTRVAAECYLHRETKADIARLRAALEGACPLTRDGLKVNRSALSATLGITLAVLNSPLYDSIISEKDAQVLESAKTSLLDPFFHGRQYPFNRLVPLWPTAFVERMAARFKQIHIGYSPWTTKDNYRALLNSFLWIGTSQIPACAEVLQRVHLEGTIAIEPWEDVLAAYRNELVQGEYDIRTKNAYIKNLNAVLGTLYPVGLVPNLSIPTIKKIARKAKHRKSVAEVSRGTGTTPTFTVQSDVYINFARDILTQASSKYDVKVSDDDASDFLKALAGEIACAKKLPEDPAAAILLILNQRLDALCRHAERTMDKWTSHRAKADEILSQATIAPQEFYSVYSDKAVKPSDRNRLVRQFFPLRDPGRATGVANLLKVASHFFGNLLPTTTNKKAIAEFGHFFQNRYIESGSLLELDAYLNPHKDAYGAALTLYLCESGANVSVGRTLELGAIEDSDLDGYKRVTGNKARAKGKPIFVDLPIKSSALRALQWIEEQSANVRAAAPPEVSNQIFVMRIGNRCQLMT